MRCAVERLGIGCGIERAKHHVSPAQDDPAGGGRGSELEWVTERQRAHVPEPYAEAMGDAELALRRARRPLVIGMGGGGDVVGALATAELARTYDGAAPVLGGLAWERQPIDPVPGPRRPDEIVDAEELAPAILQANANTRVRDRDVYF